MKNVSMFFRKWDVPAWLAVNKTDMTILFVAPRVGKISNE
jgi:hypothetical protein